MTFYLVRHAQAGDAAKWNGKDVDRPLSDRGLRQSAAIAEHHRNAGIERLVSSPARRCVQTLEPLGELLELTVETDARLSEGTSVDETMALIDELGDGVVLCSHGDVVTEAVNALIRRGVELDGEPDWRKGVVWVIDLDGEHGGRARALPPPDREPV